MNNPPAPPPKAAPPSEPATNAPQPLKGIPFPWWVICFMVVTGGAFLWGLARTGRSVKMGVYYERAKREAIEGNYRDAVKHLKSVVDAYPDATDVKIDLASAYLNSNQFSECEMILLGFEGTMVTTEESGRLNSIGRDVVAREQRFDTGDKASASPAPARGQR